MHSTTKPGTLLTVTRALARESEDNRTHEEDLADWTAYEWSRVLLHLPVDAQSFIGRFERSWDALIDDLYVWCTRFPQRPDEFRQRFEEVSGYLGLLLITLVSLRHSDAYRHPRQPESDQQADPTSVFSHDCAQLCIPLLERSAVRQAIRAVYAPDAWVPDQEPDGVEADRTATAEWDRIDMDSLRFHRHGTTSFLLAGLPAEAVHGRHRPLALKCLIYPYLRVPTIVRATREYMSRYGTPSRDARRLVRIWASSGKWILMDYVPGETLAEYLAREQQARPAASAAFGPRVRTRRPAATHGIRLDLLAELGRELLTALADLERASLRHCDLSPSNIIVTRQDDQISFVLVDLGVNYLYTHTVPGMGGPDATYIAPEVSAEGTATERTDLYSLGQLLVTISGTARSTDGPVPDSFYAETPVMARFLEDLLDGDPHHRLVIFRPESDHPLYPVLLNYFNEELAAMVATRAEHGVLPGPRLLTGLVDLFRPLAGAPGRQKRMWQLRRSQHLYRNPRRGMHVRWLLFWSYVSAAAWYVAATVVVVWWLRDLQWEWGNQAIAILQRLTHTPPDRFPYLDELRQPSYPIPDLVGNLPVRMVGMSFLLVGARYYQNLFAGITTLVAGLRQGRLSVLALLAEAHMRLFSVMAFVLVLPPNLIQRSWWPIFTAIGMLFTFLCNWTCLAFARLALSRARKGRLSTVPRGRTAGLESFSDWTPSAAFYAAAVWTIGMMVYFGLVRDVFVYAGAVTAINVVLFYIIKCSGTSAGDVRTGLGRAVLAAERLRYTQQ